MKKLINKLFCGVFAGFFLFLNSVASADEADKFIGRWAEKISERVVADIYSDKNDKEYKIFITWREDNLAQKDIYRFSAKKENGILKYKNGVHLYRYFEKDGKTYMSETDYSDGFGAFEIKNGELIWKDSKDKTESTFIKANKDLLKDTTLKNKYFSITLPREFKGSYEAKIKKDSIALYHKDSKKAGFGGFAFALKIYKNPSDHAMSFGSIKIGELTDKKGNLYDMVLVHPTDVQYDYTKNFVPDNYKILYEIGDNIAPIGIKGSNYHKNQGMKGKDLYKEVLDRHIKAIKEKWDSTKLEKENMSYMYNVLAKTNKDVLNKIGYYFYDANVDGIDELFIGEIAKGNFKGVAYDIYTMINRKPAHVVSGGTRDRYFTCDNSFICREYSSGALESGTLVYVLTENSTELFPQVGFKYDGYKNKKNPWFISYNFDNNEWENVSKEKYDDRKKVFNRYERFNYIPLKQWNNKD